MRTQDEHNIGSVWPKEETASSAQLLLDALRDPSRKKLLLPTDDATLAPFCVELGVALRGQLYVHGEDIVTIDKDGTMKLITAQALRTIVERVVVCCALRVRGQMKNVVKVNATMPEDTARGVLASPFFRECLQPIRRINNVSVPVMRSSGKIELLHEGYDSESQTFTVAGVDYREDMPLGEAKVVINNLLGEFVFADETRSNGVAIAAMVGLYGRQLIDWQHSRPVFVLTKNAEGAGATTLARCIVIPTFGAMALSTFKREEEERRKFFTSELRAGRQVIVLDNVKGKINSDSLEALATSTRWTERTLGSLTSGAYENHVTVFITANGASVTGDLRRRTLFSELHLNVEYAENRVFKTPLNEPVLIERRHEILAALWSFITHWDELGRPIASKSNSSFPAWGETFGGIVEAAGYGCIFAESKAADEADEEHAGVRDMTEVMQPERKYRLTELVELCRTNEIFSEVVGCEGGAIDKAIYSRFGKVLKKWSNRSLSQRLFHAEGTDRARRFWVSVVAESQHMEGAQSCGDAHDLFVEGERHDLPEYGGT